MMKIDSDFSEPIQSARFFEFFISILIFIETLAIRIKNLDHLMIFQKSEKIEFLDDLKTFYLLINQILFL